MIIKNDSSLAQPADDWKPIKNSDSVAESSNSSDNFLNTGELMPKAKAKTEKRSFNVKEEGEEEDSMRSVRDDSASLEEAIEEGIDENEMMNVNSNEAEEKFVTVQLFPYRLGDIFDRAEKYARNTLFPLLSEQISSIFSGETKDEKSKSTNNNAINIVPKLPSKSTRKFVEDESNDLVTSASSYVKSNELTMSKSNNNLNTVQTLQKLDMSQLGASDTGKLKPPIQKLLSSRKLEDDSIEKESVKIDLPTYKPPIDSDKIFIPIDRSSFLS